jgi:hypothetical protein
MAGGYWTFHCNGQGSIPGQVTWTLVVDEVALGQVFSK